MARRMKKVLHRPQRNSSSAASPLAMSLLQYGHLISGNSLLVMMVKVLRPVDYPPILRFVSPETTRQADTPQAACLRLWGRGAACSRRAGGGVPAPRLCQFYLCRVVSSHSRSMASSVFTSAAASFRRIRGPRCPSSRIHQPGLAIIAHVQTMPARVRGRDPLASQYPHGSTTPHTGQHQCGPSGVSTSRRAWPQTGQQAGARRERAGISAAPAAAVS